MANATKVRVIHPQNEKPMEVNFEDPHAAKYLAISAAVQAIAEATTQVMGFRALLRSFKPILRAGLYIGMLFLCTAVTLAVTIAKFLH